MGVSNFEASTLEGSEFRALEPRFSETTLTYRGRFTNAPLHARRVPDGHLD